MKIKKGIEEALKARERSYSPYSKFKGGTAIELKDGTYIHGTNVENVSYGLTSCGERNALFSLICQGYNPKDIVAMYVVGDTPEPLSPCGACRQVMIELVPREAKIVLANLEGKTRITNVEELLPFAFVEFEGDND
ncbi:MAG: cytidine deaminase [Acholeplasmataceae bacterium]|jgi:cytidine deaminase